MGKARETGKEKDWVMVCVLVDVCACASVYLYTCELDRGGELHAKGMDVNIYAYFIHTCLCVCSVYVCRMYSCVRVYVCVFVCSNEGVCVYICVCLGMDVYMRISYICVYVCVCIVDACRMYSCVRVRVYACMRGCMCIYMCVCRDGCIYKHISYVCICVFV